MSSNSQIQSREQADAFEILAWSVPDIIRARQKRPKILPKVARQMGNITEKVANLLGVEICSIFLVEQESDADSGPVHLVLAEAFGYDVIAVGGTKWPDRGLTAKIAGFSEGSTVAEPRTIVRNFTVQDHSAWAGQFDTELRGHGWTFLGVPIVGANGKPTGVIKLENKKSGAHSDVLCTHLGTTAIRVNTPKQIQTMVHSLTECARNVLADSTRTSNARDISKILNDVNRLAQELCQVCDRLSCDIPYRTEAHETVSPLDPLDEAEQRRLMDSLQLQTIALRASLDSLETPALSSNTGFAQSCAELRDVITPFSLALGTYVPFSRKDVHLVRAVAALIAAAIDSSEGTTQLSLHSVEHAFKGKTAEFLMWLSDVSNQTTQLWKANSKLHERLKLLWTTALTISGPSDVIGLNDEKSGEGGETLGQLLKNDLMNRFNYYNDCAEVWNKQFNRPTWKVGELDQLQNIKLPRPDSLIVGVCDILFVNAVRSGGEIINVKVEDRGDYGLIIFQDNGSGIPEDKLKVFDRPDASPDLAHFGLWIAKHALGRRQLGLELLSNGKRAGESWTQVAIRIPKAPRGVDSFNQGVFSETHATRKKVLLVEDEPDEAGWLRETIATLPLDVEMLPECDSLQDVVDKVIDGKEMPDCAIIDVKVFRSSASSRNEKEGDVRWGIEVLERLVKAGMDPATILIITAHKDTVVAEYPRLPFLRRTRSIHKPIHPETIKSVLTEVLSG